jgi:hypothetical protein
VLYIPHRRTASDGRCLTGKESKKATGKNLVTVACLAVFSLQNKAKRQNPATCCRRMSRDVAYSCNLFQAPAWHATQGI